MGRQLLFCVLCIMLCLSASPAPGEDQDLLDELDTLMDSGQEDGTKKEAVKADQEIGDQISKHFLGELRLRGYGFFKDSPNPSPFVDDSDYVGEVLLKGSTWVQRDFWSVHASGWFEAGTQEDTYTWDGIGFLPRDRNRERNHLELNELYLTLSGENKDLTLGRKVFRPGISTIYSPSVRYRFLDLNDPLDWKDLGAWQATLDYYSGDTTFTGSIRPVYQPTKIPSSQSRWMLGSFGTDAPGIGPGGLPNFNFNILPGSFDELVGILYYFWNLIIGGDLGNALAGRNVIFQYDIPDYDPEDYGYYGRVKTTFGLWDVYGSVYHGPGIYPVLRYADLGNVVAVVGEIPNVFNLSSGFSTTYKGFEFHGEALYNRTEDNKDDDYINYVVGVTYSDQVYVRKLGIERADVTVEYAGEKITRDPDPNERTISSRDARLGRDDIFVNLLLMVRDDLRFHYLGDIVFWNRSQFHRFGGTYRIRPGLNLGLNFEFFSGDETSYFGRWRDNDRVIATLTWSF